MTVTAHWNYDHDERVFGQTQLALAHERELVHQRTAYYPHPTSDPLSNVPDGFTVVASGMSREGDGGVVILDHDPTKAIVSLSLNGGLLSLTVMARTAAEAEEVVAALVDAFPEEKLPPNSDKVLVHFWMMTAQGPKAMPRKIVVPSWEQIEENYPSGPSVGLNELLSKRTWAQEHGQLLLWTGTPGTGKTYALRALAREWSGWCDVHYITDPEQFFGAHADYMMQVMFHSSNDARTRWKLLVLEDSGEMLSTDAKDRVGQALSRLLNVVDGLIGQGLQVIVLVTTNEEIKNLHEAVARPGRCAQRLTFDRFHGDEAVAWLKDRGCNASASSSYTLAELYAELDETSMNSHSGNGRVAGFA